MDEEQEAAEAFWHVSIKPLVRNRKYGDAIERVRARLETETTIAIRVHLLRYLADLLLLYGRDEEELQAIQQIIELAPDDPLSWHRLAGWHFYGHGSYDADLGTLQSALHAVDMALEKARPGTDDVRFHLNERCRIAVAMNRYDLVEDTLRQILETRGLPGIQFEGDFLDRIPEGAIDPELLATYKALLAEQEARRAKRRPPA